jgi:hypothetical protein
VLASHPEHLVAAPVPAAASRAGARAATGGAARGAVTKLAEAVVVEAAGAPAAFTEVAGIPSPSTAAAAAASGDRQPVAARVASRVSRMAAAARGGAGFGAFPLAAALRDRRRRLRLFEVTGQDLVHKSQCLKS